MCYSQWFISITHSPLNVLVVGQFDCLLGSSGLSLLHIFCLCCLWMVDRLAFLVYFSCSWTCILIVIWRGHNMVILSLEIFIGQTQMSPVAPQCTAGFSNYFIGPDTCFFPLCFLLFREWFQSYYISWFEIAEFLHPSVIVFLLFFFLKNKLRVNVIRNLGLQQCA